MSPISIFRQGATPADPLSLVGSIEFTYSGPTLAHWIHSNTALLIRHVAGSQSTYELYFQIGSEDNHIATDDIVPVTSTIGLSHEGLAADALYRMTIVDDGATVTGSNIELLAIGLRNASGFDFHPDSGDLYLVDNGFDQPGDDFDIPVSADELNVIGAAMLGNSVPDFGFPENYIEHGTNVFVGGEGTPPLVAFQPVPFPDGDHAGGPNQLVFAPEAFPETLRNGFFTGMHGIFHSGGLANSENPLVFVDADDNSYFHFIGNNEPNIGHLDGLLATDDSLFVSDISPTGPFNDAQLGTGIIYQIKSVVDCLPGDFNADGSVDAADYVVWRENFGSPYTMDHYNVWRANFGTTTAGAAASTSNRGTAVICEPTGYVLAGLLVLVAGSVARRR